MRKLFYILTAVFITASAFAQTPEKVIYQAVIRDAQGALAINKNIEITIRILQGSDSGTEVYRETHGSLTTNSNGLVSLEIGSGACDCGHGSGYFSMIDWDKNGSYFIKTQTAIDGETITSTAELLSVPYALYAKDASTVSGFALGDHVPESADFTDDQTAMEVPLADIGNLDATDVQVALEALNGAIDDAGGDMKKTDYDANDGTVNNAATVNNLRVGTSVPAEALFTDTQKGSEVDLATAVDIDSDGRQETTVESALIKLNDLMKKLQEETFVSIVSKKYRPCLTTHYEDTTDLVSFVTGTEGTVGSGEEQSAYCHYIYGNKTFVSFSYKIIERDLLQVTEDVGQALSTSFIAEPSKAKSINFTQPLLCQHTLTGKWGYEQTWEENKVCVFGLSFSGDDHTLALDRGAGLDYKLYTLASDRTDVNNTAYEDDKYKCGQVNARILPSPGTIFLDGRYDPENGTCRIIGQDNTEQELHDNFFVYSDSPVENYIYEALGTMFLDKQIYDQFHSSSKRVVDKFAYTQGINVVSGFYESMEYWML